MLQGLRALVYHKSPLAAGSDVNARQGIQRSDIKLGIRHADPRLQLRRYEGRRGLAGDAHNGRQP